MNGGTLGGQEKGQDGPQLLLGAGDWGGDGIADLVEGSSVVTVSALTLSRITAQAPFVQQEPASKPAVLPSLQ